MKGGSLALETMKTVVHKDDVIKHPLDYKKIL